MNNEDEVFEASYIVPGYVRVLYFYAKDRKEARRDMKYIRKTLRLHPLRNLNEKAIVMNKSNK